MLIGMIITAIVVVVVLAIIAINSVKVANDMQQETIYCLPSQYLINHFVGRERETDDIIVFLDYKTVDVGILNIHGSPGFGKSTLAIYVGHHMLERDVTVIHIDLRETSKDEIQQVLAEKTYECISSNYEAVNFKQLLQWVKKLRKFTLIILDNCDDVLYYQKERLQHALVKIIEKSRKLKILMTSREVILQEKSYFDELQTRKFKHRSSL